MRKMRTESLWLVWAYVIVLILFASSYMAHASIGGGLPGIYPWKTSRTDYSVTTVLTSAFTTLVTSTSIQTNSLELADSGGQAMVIAWAPTCATLSATSNAVLIPPNSSGALPLYIPPTMCVGVEAVASSPSTGELDITFFR